MSCFFCLVFCFLFLFLVLFQYTRLSLFLFHLGIVHPSPLSTVHSLPLLRERPRGRGRAHAGERKAFCHRVCESPSRHSQRRRVFCDENGGEQVERGRQHLSTPGNFKVCSWIFDPTPFAHLLLRANVNRLRHGDDEKRKHYRALVWIAQENFTEKDVDEINKKFEALGEIVIQQKTPIRVLHRRTNMTRTRSVYYIRAKYEGGSFFSIELVTQAGTYFTFYILLILKH